MKHTIEMKRKGEIAARRLSKKASSVYNETDPMSIYEVSPGSYDIISALGDYKGLSFEELNAELESLYDVINGEED